MPSKDEAVAQQERLTALRNVRRVALQTLTDLASRRLDAQAAECRKRAEIAKQQGDGRAMNEWRAMQKGYEHGAMIVRQEFDKMMVDA